MKELNTKQRGITLIALIITIIVMLILVGVTINVAISGGLFSKAREAAAKTNRAILNEELNSIIAAMNMDIAANPQKYNLGNEEENVYIFFETILVELEKNFEVDSKLVLTTNDGENDIRILDFERMQIKGLVAIDEDTGKILLTVPCKYKGNDVNVIVEIKATDEGIELIEFRLQKNNGISTSQTGETPTLTAGGNIKELTEEGVPIPKGFYYVTGTKDTGVVISDSQADENKEDGNSGNQYVWVPVEINQKLNIKIDTGKVIKTVRILNLDGYDETFEPNSDYFEKTINLIDNNIYEIIATYEDGTTDDKLYYADKNYSNTAVVETVRTSILLLMSLGNSEEVVFDALKENALENNPDAILYTKIDILKGGLLNSVEEELSDVSDDINEKTSVLKYGGFYIGRYEMGENKALKKGITPKHNVTFEEAKTEAEGIYNDSDAYGVKSALPSGAAYDRVFSWIVSTGAKKEEEVCISSKNWGNFRSSWNSPERLVNTGYGKANNIFDLAGNVEEWTTEMKNNENVSRGGNCSQLAGYAYSRSTDKNNSYIGYRPILYFYE